MGSVCLFDMRATCVVGTSHAAYQEVVKELLRQAETQCYKQERRLVWLQAVKPTFEASTMMPQWHCHHSSPADSGNVAKQQEHAECKDSLPSLLMCAW